MMKYCVYRCTEVVGNSYPPIYMYMYICNWRSRDRVRNQERSRDRVLTNADCV